VPTTELHPQTLSLCCLFKVCLLLALKENSNTTAGMRIWEFPCSSLFPTFPHVAKCGLEAGGNRFYPVPGRPLPCQLPSLGALCWFVSWRETHWSHCSIPFGPKQLHGLFYLKWVAPPNWSLVYISRPDPTPSPTDCTFQGHPNPAFNPSDCFLSYCFLLSSPVLGHPNEIRCVFSILIGNK
jgi:hypothetical protein